MLPLILRSLIWYLRTHLLVFLAVAVSTAVIGGSLIVGDSVRASLRQMTLGRLGGISHVVHGPRFIREDLAADLSGALKAAPALILPGSMEFRSADGLLRRAAGVSLNGVRREDWDLFAVDSMAAPGTSGIVLGARTAAELGAQVGDRVTIWAELPSSIPRDSLMGERETVSAELELTVEGVLSENAGASRFSLQAAQQLPHTAFLNLRTFQERLKLEPLEATRRNPTARPGRVNTLLFGQPADTPGTASQSTPQLIGSGSVAARQLQRSLSTALTLPDVGLTIRSPAGRSYLSVESSSMILEDGLSAAVQRAAKELGMAAEPTLVYLANELNAVNRTDPATRYSMYSIVAGLNLNAPAPLGPGRLADGSPVAPLSDTEIIVSAWLAEDLQVAVGDQVEARWHEVGSHGDLPERFWRFTVRGILSPDDPLTVDQDLTPFVDGVTNVDSFADWDQPFPMQMERITSRDDAWWDAHKATPKAFISLAVAEKLWAGRFGRSTSIRVASPGAVLPPERLEILRERLENAIQAQLQPERLGLAVRAIRAEGLLASTGANNFTWLFIGFSFFLIVSALLLAALMFQLGVRLRVSQVGLMEAVGFPPERARRVLVLEGLVVSLLGSVAGAGLAVVFARLMILGLTTRWVGAIGTRFLFAEIRPGSLIAAVAVTFVLSGLAIHNAVRRTTQRTPKELLAGLASDHLPDRRGRFSGLLSGLSAVVAVVVGIALPAAIVARLIPAGEAFGGLSWPVVCFFLAGFAWLSAGLLVLQRLLRRRAGDDVSGGELLSLTGLAIANAARNPHRSLLTTALIAFAAFVIVAVGAGRRNPVSEIPDLRSGNGGFSLIAESSLPILFDLNTPAGRQKLELPETGPGSLPQNTRVFSFRMRPGEDASCLNLFQTQLPTLLGARPEFINRGGFRFADTPGDNPWRLLQAPADSVKVGDAELPAIPVIGDLNTLQFSLKKKMGDVILFPDATAPTHVLRVAGMLDSSIFQGVLVMSEEHLLRLAPETSGARWLLLETARPEEADAASAALETALRPLGVDVELVSRRLADFLAVQNTYLSTFQLLGGLGLLVGTLGLAAVMMRNVVERRRELALMRALGFRWLRILWLVAAENTALLFWGLVVGSLSALVAMFPHLRSTGADVPWQELGWTLLAVAGTGTLAVLLPLWSALRITVRDVLTGE
ncbi:MAG: FtsX-like permease family protein [Planctomycetota bacterium]